MAYLLIFIVAVFLAIMCAACGTSSEPPVSVSPQPSISDEEFCALMPDVRRDVALKVRDILADATGWDRDEIHPKTRLAEFEH